MIVRVRISGMASIKTSIRMKSEVKQGAAPQRDRDLVSWAPATWSAHYCSLLAVAGVVMGWWVDAWNGDVIC